MSLVEKIKHIVASTLIVTGLGATYLASHKINKDMNAKVLNTLPITIAYDKNRDGTPDFVLEGWIARLGGGYFSDMKTRPATEEEIREYQSK